MYNHLTRIEELPSGKRVLYIDIGNLPPSEVNKYVKDIMEICKSDDMHYVIPVRSMTNRNKIDIETLLFNISLVILACNFVGLLIQIIK